MNALIFIIIGLYAVLAIDTVSRGFIGDAMDFLKGEGKWRKN